VCGLQNRSRRDLARVNLENSLPFSLRAPRAHPLAKLKTDFAASVETSPIMLDKAADAERRLALREILTPDGIVLDVGANRGQFALGQLYGAKAQVFCF